ncbi:hypothetical protein KP733_11145 [Streptococcus equi subsp. zooepidemicus]|uniref:hypothetical protein n=1 Tax=Streptococcus equi TaxID=1336 RepID=UPI001E50F71B|nr:hypothetical protein [Streptococcus equi]MCD3387859.1 hypothetical protein [Streptococcus equi subsp. zooepidemicus]
MIMRKFLRYIYQFIIFSIAIGVLVGLLIPSDNVILSKPERGWDFTLEVLKNNSNHFLSYIFLFFLSQSCN